MTWIASGMTAAELAAAATAAGGTAAAAGGAGALGAGLGAGALGAGAAEGVGAIAPAVGAEAAGGLGLDQALMPLDVAKPPTIPGMPSTLTSPPDPMSLFGGGGGSPPVSTDIPYSHPDTVAGPSMANGDFSAPQSGSPGMFDNVMGWMKEKQPMLDATSKFTKSMSEFGKFLNGTPDGQPKTRLDQALPQTAAQPQARPATPMTSSQPAAMPMPSGTEQPAGPAGLPRTQIARSVMPSLNPQMTPAERLQLLQGSY
jgi:hypothetical protein